MNIRDLKKKVNREETEQKLKKLKTEYEVANKEAADLQKKADDLQSELARINSLESATEQDSATSAAVSIPPEALNVCRAIPFGYVNPNSPDNKSLEIELQMYRRMLNEAVNEVITLRRRVHDLTLEINVRRSVSYESQSSQSDAEHQERSFPNTPDILDSGNY